MREALAPYFRYILGVHVTAVVLSGTLFAARGVLGLAGRPAFTQHPAVRRLSYLNDTVLLAAGVLLAVLIGQYPFAEAWLTVKVAVLVLYVFLGVIALRTGRTRRVRAWAFAGALASFAFIVSVAITRNPWGVLGSFG